MTRRRNHEASAELRQQVVAKLDEALSRAEAAFSSEEKQVYGLSEKITKDIEAISALSQKASTGFTNIVTSLAIKIAQPEVDIRYHQVQIQNQTPRPAGFNFRGVSEIAVFPWLNEHNFDGAKSGWQTRTFERPKPYMLDYDENIGDIKEAFLSIYNEIEVNGQSAEDALIYLLYLQLVQRESKKIILSTPRTTDINLITYLFRQHFFFPYKASKGAARLPVLALYAIYTVLIRQIERYQGMELKPLEDHSAADSQTEAR
jgi:DNA (cytosine-5)-methyltransferase 1